jgi:nucleoid DNA-binding protein
MQESQNLSPRIRRHLVAITESSGLGDGQEALRLITENWLEKRRLFSDQIRMLGMEEIERLTANDPRGALLLTYSGSLISLGSPVETNRAFEYASIKLRADVPDLVRDEAVRLAGDIEVDRPAAFEGGSLQRSSDVLTIAICPEDIPTSEQERRLREATIFLTNGFVKLNRSLSISDEAPEQFTLKAVIRYVANRNGMSQVLARSVIDDYLAVLESGLMLGERVSLGRMGRFQLHKRPPQKARLGHNPATGEQLLIPAKPATYVPRFSASTDLKERAARVPVNDES